MLIFLALLVLLCIKACRKTNKSVLSINKTIKKPKRIRTKKNLIPKEFTNKGDEVNSKSSNSDLIQHQNIQVNTEINQSEIQIKTLNQEDQKKEPIVENEFQILRRQLLLSNIRNNNDNYENIYNNDLRKNYIYKN